MDPVHKAGRGHHFVPAFYLNRFATPEDRGGRLWVFDRPQHRKYSTTPNDAARRKAFYQVAVRSDPNAIEDALARIEDITAPIIASVLEQRALPDDPDRFGSLVMFVALQAARGTSVRDPLCDFVERVARARLRILASKPAVLAARRREVEAATGKSLHRVTAEHFQTFVADARIEVDTTWAIRQQLQLADMIFELLLPRAWVLGTGPEEGPEFVTSDSPVTVVHPMPARRFGPFAFEIPGSVVHYPLSPRVLLLGFDRARAERRPAPTRTTLVASAVAKFNAIIVAGAHEFVFSRHESFEYGQHRACVRTSDDLWPPQKAKARSAR